MDLSPGSGALFEAALSRGFLYHGLCRNRSQMNWPQGIADRATCGLIATEGSSLLSSECRSAASLREPGNLETSLPEDGHIDEATPLATETAGVHAVAPRGSALLNGRLGADARSELPADILQSIEDVYSAVLAVWITRFDSLQNSLLLKAETEEQKQICLAAFQDRVRAACNGARSDRVRDNMIPYRTESVQFLASLQEEWQQKRREVYTEKMTKRGYGGDFLCRFDADDVMYRERHLAPKGLNNV
ncbi:unnamed protein product [Symbiodinium necroappetens]|uniref:Uncharacterized protein n=1 Tax=Symbiodinium necroappetens TaxID=1628268 RepID=A0A812KAM3_9DINO|nr:unnamed protein product [Symbiodinium necroappetens]